MDFAFMLEILPRLLRGLILTIQVSVLALLLGTVIGIALGIVRIIGPRPVRTVISWYVTLIRGTPAIFHIYAASLLLPKIGIELSVFWVGLIALTLNTVGYQIEIVRAALESIDYGQREAAASIGMTNWMAMRLIILPQAARRIIPPLTNELANLIKASSALSVIAVLEMTKIANSIRASTFKSPEVYVLVAILYFIVIQLLIWGANYLEQNVFNYQRAEKRVAAGSTAPIQAG